MKVLWVKTRHLQFSTNEEWLSRTYLLSGDLNFNRKQVAIGTGRSVTHRCVDVCNWTLVRLSSQPISADLSVYLAVDISCAYRKDTAQTAR
jgi:hypothetical protein